MSGQGSSGTATQPLSYEDELLKCWGEWARTSKLGTEYASLKQKDSILGFMFTENTILLADLIIAGLPRAHKKTIKRWYWWLEQDIDERRVNMAVAEFSESLSQVIDT